MAILSKLNRVNWIADVFTPLAVVLMEVFCVYPWLVFIGKLPAMTFQKTPLSLLALIFLLGISFIATKFFLSRKWPMPWIQVGIITCGLVAIFLVIRIEYSDGFKLLSGQWFVSYGQVLLDSFSHQNPFIFALLAGFYLWWRGIGLSRSKLSFASIYPPFLIELATLVLLIIIWGFSFKTGPSDIGIYIAVFFFFGLTSLALSNLRVLQERMKAKGEASKTFGRRWLSIIISAIGGIILIGIGFASIFSTQFVSSLGRILNLAANAFSNAVYYLFLAVGFLVEWIYYVGEFILNWFRHGKPPQPPQPVNLGNPNNSQNVTKGGISPQVMLILKWTVLALVLIGVLFLITRAIMRRHSARAQDDLEEEHESLWSWEGFRSDVIVFFKMFFQRFKRKARPVPASVSLNRQEDNDIRRRLSIREIYQHLLWQGARSRIPRELYETPFEYARRLGQAVPDGREPLNEIAKLYIDVRYGELQTEEKQIDVANNIWEKVRNLLKGLESN